MEEALTGQPTTQQEFSGPTIGDIQPTDKPDTLFNRQPPGGWTQADEVKAELSAAKSLGVNGIVFDAAGLEDPLPAFLQLLKQRRVAVAEEFFRGKGSQDQRF